MHNKNKGEFDVIIIRLLTFLNGIGHPSSSNVFVGAISLFSKVFAKILLGSVVLCTFSWRAFILSIHEEFWDGLPERWANTCLDCFFSANLDWGVKLPTSWGQGVYMTGAWSADCGFKPNGHSICCLLPRGIDLLTQGWRQIFLYSHRVRSSFFSIYSKSHVIFPICKKVCPTHIACDLVL